MKLILQSFTDALEEKVRGNMAPAAEFIDQFDVLAVAADVPPNLVETLRRGMFLILKAK